MLKQFEYLILGVLVALVLAFLWIRVIRPRRRAAAARTADAAADRPS